jgi:hypothetical protein
MKGTKGTGKESAALQDSPQNQIESKPAIEAELAESGMEERANRL